MGLFDSFADSPNQIKTEGETITILYKPGLPAAGQATIEWNIPSAAQGCGAAEDGRGAYCGFLITVASTPQQAAQQPVDGTYYTGDPNVDIDLHAGDTINGALVLAAFYEGEARVAGESLTTSLVVSGIEDKTQYFVAGHAIDCQGRYHTQGVKAYSSEYGNPDSPDSPANQVIEMNSGQGVLPTDGTNLTPGTIYEFDVEINSNFPANGTINDIINVKVDGTDVQTYEDLVDEVNAQLALADNPAQSPVPPNSGSFLVDSTNASVSQYNGTSYDPISTLFELTDPSDTPVGSYWYDPDTLTLRQRDAAGTGWDTIDLIQYPENPSTPQCDDYWFNGTQAYQYNGSTWCEVDTISKPTDPTIAPGGSCGLFWYDTVNSELQEWDVASQGFEPTSALFWDQAPNAFDVGTLWYNLSDNTLYERNAASEWEAIDSLLVQSTTPVTPFSHQYWYDPEHETLQLDTEFAGPGGTFVDVPFIAWAEDPTITSSCTLWWDSNSDKLFIWDVVNNEWDSVVTFVQQDTDPTLAVTYSVGTLWHDSETDTMNYWDGSEFTAIPTINTPTDPEQPTEGAAWLDTTTGTVSIYDPVDGWVEIDPTDTATDPSLIETGTYWYDITTDTLNERIGSAWTPIPYVTSPHTPLIGDQWFDTSTNVLMEWTGSSWVPATPSLAFGFTAEGNLALQTKATGSCVSVMLSVPGGLGKPGSIGTGFADFHSFGHYHSYTEDAFTAPTQLPVTNVSEQGFLFNNLPSQILPQAYGTDGLKGTSMYDIVGVGTDGTADERRELADTIRAQLGYPVVEVELTPQQMDLAITGAIESLRKRSDIAYTRGFYFLDVIPGNQIYQLTNECAGFNKIVGVMAAHRFTSAFLSASSGAGIHGQVVLQHLYNMGTYDLTSFHLVAQYVEQMEHLFATRITFNWNETTRKIHLHQSFVRPERILLDTYDERTEQELFRDRWCKSWIEKYALSQARLMLAEIRGKFASLPGAGGGISLNASDLAARADADMQELYMQLDDYTTGHLEVWGQGGQFVIG